MRRRPSQIVTGAAAGALAVAAALAIAAAPPDAPDTPEPADAVNTPDAARAADAARTRQANTHDFAAIGDEFAQTIHPLIKRLCLECHAAAKKKGKLDLQRFTTLGDVRGAKGASGGAAVFSKIIDQLEAGEMPPDDQPQPTAAQRTAIIDWARRYLRAEALANAGDPGQVVLRRLSNAEYRYTIGDLTGVPLDPTAEFPVDGAAGEGFTNAGEALVMSPVLLSKYLKAAKDIADHAVLLPDGVRFSPGKTRRDWTDEILYEIRALYAHHTTGAASAEALDRWSGADPGRISLGDGRVDLTPYFAALIRHRARLIEDAAQADAIASEEKLNAKYLRLLATMLVTGEPSSPLLNHLRARWRSASAGDAGAIAAEIRAWQDQLWRFNTVGHFGLIRPWQQANDPLPDSVTLRHKFAPRAGRGDVVLYLAAGDAGDGNGITGADDLAIWLQPRIEYSNRPAIMLRDVRALTQQVARDLATESAKTQAYLASLAASRDANASLDDLAKQHSLDVQVLRAWAEYLDLGRSVERKIVGHFTNKVSKVRGWDAINGWGSHETPIVLSNASDQPISFQTLTVPARGVTLHPSPDYHAAVAWRSPIDAKVTLAGNVADADGVCGNGVAWSVELLNAAGTSRIAEGAIDNGRDGAFAPKDALEIRKGDFISLIIAARDRSHVCDTTHVTLTIKEQGGRARTWNLAADVASTIHAGNPHADSYGNEGVWHFYAIGDEPRRQVEAIPPGSALARWKAAVRAGESQEAIEQLAVAVQKVIGVEDGRSEADAAMVATITQWDGPLNWLGRAREKIKVRDGDDAPTSDRDATGGGLDPARFGKRPDGSDATDAVSLVAKAPNIIEVRLPAPLLREGEFIVQGMLDSKAGQNASVQCRLLTDEPDLIQMIGAVAPGVPIITRPNAPARQRIAAAYDDFRSYFPAAMCYPRIVPVDETVTLLLFHREDDQLRRLMLDDAEAARLNRLWDELRFVSEEGPRLVVALEQLIEFATQDAQHLIPKLQPLKEPIDARAAALHEAQRAAEPKHVDWLLDFADRAWRRPLTDSEKQGLRDLYRGLYRGRNKEQSHEDAFRTTLARVLIAPAFLYKLEEPAPGSDAAPVSDLELATRLSYFLWSSLPDAALRNAAEAGELSDTQTLTAQTRRMLKDHRTRAFAVEFAAQWLGVRGFDQHDEKNEALYPTFAAMRGPMYEEVIRFFEDLAQRDGSVLEILNADHTFLNEALAKHYNIDGVTGEHWRRVDGLRQRAPGAPGSRGGVLGMGAVVARHSGASRTSPVLRGTWLVETILGEHLPKPPPNVPDLPETEKDTTLSIRQLTQRHRAVKECAACHDRIDPYGFALESFDTIGRARANDDAGRPIDTAVSLKTGESFDGVAGLRDYLLTVKKQQFLRQFCRKMLGYALGRAVEISDEPLLDKMLTELERSDYRISAAVLTIVRSKQFRYQRGRDAPQDGE